jgi:hypothetical protein
MDGYKMQDGCHNCKHCVRIAEYDCETVLFCGFNAPPRPKSGSVLMGEGFFIRMDTPDEEVNAIEKAWDDWAKPRMVSAQGTCNNYLSEDSNAGK